MTNLILTLILVVGFTYACSRLPIKGQTPIMLALMALSFLVIASIALRVVHVP